MTIRTYSGRVADALAFSKQTIHLAWGAGETWWHQQQTEERAFDENGMLKTARSPIEELELRSDDAVYVEGRDYHVIAYSGTVVRSLNSSIPDGATVSVVYRPGPEALTGLETALIQEVGRRRAMSVQFITPDTEGAIEDAGSNRWRTADEPTNSLLVSVKFGYAENADDVIQEVGVFVGGTAKPHILPGQDYLLPDDIEAPGYLHSIEHLSKPLIRSANKRDGIDAFIVF